MPTLLKTSGKAGALFAAFGLTQGILNALTVQPLAVDKIVPFRIHGPIEKSSAPIYFGIPILLGIHREPKARALWPAVGAALLTVYNLTDWDGRRTDK